MKLLPALWFATLSLLAATSPAQIPPILTWQQVPVGQGPSPRQSHGMVYDKANQNVVLFGGFDGSVITDDTWVWGGLGWTEAAPGNAPPARVEPAMVFDEARGSVLMFGGRDVFGVLGDMWSWDGAAWTQLTTPNMPPPLAGALVTYDPLRQVVVMFGGWDGQFFTARTYEYDGVDWTERFPSQVPPQRAYGLAWFDAAAGAVKIHGGQWASIFNFTSRDDIWSWDGVDWTNESSQPPIGRAGVFTAYAPDLQAPVRYGGSTVAGTSPTVFSDQEYWDGAAWQPLPGVVPGPRYGGAMVYDEARQELVLFGGADESPSGLAVGTWVTGQSLPFAASSVYGSNCAQSGNSILASVPVIGASASVLITQAPSAAAFLCIGLSSSQLQGAPLPLDLSPFGLTGCELLTSAEIVGLPFTVVSTVGPVLRRDESIPNDQNLIGQQAFLQAFAIAPGANPAQVVTSSGVEWTFGLF